jgi:nucleotide-binding universal stress UspA family protein
MSTVTREPSGSLASTAAPWAVRRILVPLDGTDDAEVAISTAAPLAERIGAGLTLFSWHWASGAEQYRRRYLEQIVRRWELDCELVASRSDAVDAALPLLEAAREAEGTLVCMKTHAHRAVPGFVFGSVAEELLRATDEPVMLLGPHCEEVPAFTGPVVVALDGSSRAEQGIPLGAAWAERLGTSLELVTVTERARGDGDGPGRDVFEGGYLVRTAKVSGAASWEVLHGAHAGDQVAHHASGRASLVVVTTHGRSGVARVAMGSVAMRIVHEASCPVLVVRTPV